MIRVAVCRNRGIGFKDTTYLTHPGGPPLSHCITIVDDDAAFPQGHNFVFVTLPSGALHIFYRRSALTEETLMDSWAAYRAMLRRQPPKYPTRCAVVDLERRAS